MTLPAVTCEWPFSESFVGLSQERHLDAGLGLSPSPPPGGHPKGILDLASISQEEELRLTPSRRLSLFLSLLLELDDP